MLQIRERRPRVLPKRRTWWIRPDSELVSLSLLLLSSLENSIGANSSTHPITNTIIS